MRLSDILRLLASLFWVTAAVQANHVSYTVEFKDFESCLVRNGLNSAQIVRRSDSSAYGVLNYQWQLKLPPITPLAYLLVESGADVVAAVKCGRAARIRVIPKSGGHNFEKYSFGDSESIVLDLRKLSAVEVSDDRSQATVGAGILLGPLVYSLWKSAKVFIPTGYCPAVGVSGVALGGGYGNFAQTYGLTTDQILKMTLVTANGSLITASATENSDVFWALRGAGATSFGIVTQFTFRVFKAPKVVFLGTLTYNLALFPPVFEIWQKYLLGDSRKITTEIEIVAENFLLRFVDPSGLNHEFEKFRKSCPPPTNISRIFLPFDEYLFYEAKYLSFSVGPQVQFNKPKDLANIDRFSTEPQFVQRKSFYVTKPMGKLKILELHNLIVARPPSMQAWFEPYGGAINDFRSTETAFVHRQGRIYCAVASYRNVNPTQLENEIGISWLHTFHNFFVNVLHAKESYQNYVDSELTDYLQRYYGKNLKRLISVKRKYDPENYFRNPQSIPTVLPKKKF